MRDKPAPSPERLPVEPARARPDTAISSCAVAPWHLAFSIASSDFVLERYRQPVSVTGMDDPVSAAPARAGDFSWVIDGVGGQRLARARSMAARCADPSDAAHACRRGLPAASRTSMFSSVSVVVVFWLPLFVYSAGLPGVLTYARLPM
jgi:hypothetical protein